MNKIIAKLFLSIIVVSPLFDNADASLFSRRSSKTEKSVTDKKAEESGTKRRGLRGFFSRTKDAVVESAKEVANTAIASAENVVDSTMTMIEDTVDTVGKSISDSISLGVYSQSTIAKIDPEFRSIKSNTEKKVFDLSFKNITDDDIMYLVKKLSEASSNGKRLITLDISNNAITAKGASMLFEFINKEPSIIAILDISNNKLGDSFVRKNANKIKDLSGLKYLVMSNSNITGDGALTLLASICAAEYPSIQMIDLSDNQIENEYWPQIIDQMKKLSPNVLEHGVIFKGNPINASNASGAPANAIL
ncbi:MAG: hypothetical protein IJ481_02345 [Alphaproteobacteria bacterium]|nr:hypothetical protein [Alphaproteobacteria bacterium]